MDGMKKNIALIFIFMLTACSPASTPTVEPAPVAATAVPPTDAPPPSATATFTLIPPTSAPTATPIPFVESLSATVTADLLSCRYGPGPEYLYLFAFKKGANIKLIGRTDGNNWVLVENEPQRCWIKADFVAIQGR